MILFKNNSLAAILYSAKSEIDAIVDIYSLVASIKKKKHHLTERHNAIMDY